MPGSLLGKAPVDGAEHRCTEEEAERGRHGAAVPECRLYQIDGKHGDEHASAETHAGSIDAMR
jgi:hypothetical protein